MSKAPIHLHAIVLAAGLSRRMGTANKLLLPYGSHTILEEVLTQLSQTSIRSITVVLGHEEEKVKKAIASFPVTTVFNPDFAAGQGSSIRAGVEALPPEARGFLICLGDMPSIKASDYQKGIAYFGQELLGNSNVIWRPFRKGQPGHPVGFARSYQSAILAGDDPDGNKSVVQKNKQHLVKWETKESVYFLDIDTQEEYKTWINS